MRTAPALVLFGMVLWQSSCGGPDINTDRTPPEGGVDFFDGGFEDDSGPAPGPCPDSIPKVGESCGPGTDESTSCEFPQGQCLASNGMYYNETARYCCPNGVWEPCGGASPCDLYDDAGEPPPPADAAVTNDAVTDGPDGGIDTTSDSAPDAPAVD
jgi:hypothetical protein